MNFKDNLKKIRKDNNLSQEELAEKLNVTRQSVSKWESGVAYPEMDKVIQICKMFNLNIDDLLNKDIKEVNEAKESKSILNKYVDDFLGYITKAVKVICSMSLSQIIKCLLEQGLIVLILLMVFGILGSIGSTIVSSIFGMLPYGVYHAIFGLLDSIYIILATIISITIIVHIFKIRYLDYYEIEEKEVEDKKEKVVKEVEDEEDKPQTKEAKKEKTKIIIRDPKHSGYGFIGGLAKCILLVVKFFVACILLGAFASLVGEAIALILSFVFVKTGLLFLGAFIGLIGSILITVTAIYILFNFIVDKKSKIGFIFISLLISLISIGMGIGLFVSGIKDYRIADDNDSRYTKEIVKYEMNDSLVVNNIHVVTFKEDDRSDIKIEVIHTDYTDVEVENKNNIISFDFNDSYDGFDIVRNVIDDINDKKLVDYGRTDITIYASKENIDKLVDNYHKNFKR